MLDCVHEWQLLQEASKITNPPKVNIGCKWCKSQTWELETDWLAHESKPTVHNRITKLEKDLSVLCKVLLDMEERSKSLDKERIESLKEEKKPKKVKK